MNFDTTPVDGSIKKQNIVQDQTQPKSGKTKSFQDTPLLELKDQQSNQSENDNMKKPLFFEKIPDEKKFFQELLETRGFQNQPLNIPENKKINIPPDAISLEGIFRIHDETYYSGQWKGRTFHGYGILINKHQIYQGYWLNGKQHQYGQIVKVSGQTYKGDFFEGLVEGRGRLQKSNGYSYDGEWKNNQKHGYGVEISPNQFEYKGNYVNNLKEGQGELINKDGSKYVGEFLQNKFNGRGNLTSKNFIYEGEFKDDKFHGYGKISWSTGNSYQGQYVNGQKEGKGEFKWADGTVYLGEFLNGKQEGKGVIIDKNGKEMEYLWSQGKRIQESGISIQSKVYFLSEINKIQSEFSSPQRQSPSKVISCRVIDEVKEKKQDEDESVNAVSQIIIQKSFRFDQQLESGGMVKAEEVQCEEEEKHQIEVNVREQQLGKEGQIIEEKADGEISLNDSYSQLPNKYKLF